ncbi:MAG: aspartate/glutamate racemase family protein [Bacillota bacterium]
MHKIGLIRVVTLLDQALLQAHGRLIEASFPGLTVESRCLPNQPNGIHDQETLALAVPNILKVGLGLAAEGAEAVVVSCMMDPGVDLLRRHLSIPVIGSGSAGAAVALACSKRIGVLGITDRPPEPVAGILKGSLVAAGKPEGVKTTIDLLSEERRACALREAEVLVRKGAEVILLGCTGFSTVGIAGEIRKALKVRVIDPVIASGLVAWYSIRSGNFGVVSG